MTEQDMREKVIKGLECCDGYCDDETGCPYYDELESFDCQEQLRADAIALLKAQEPRVMALEECKMREVVWVEDRETLEVYPCLVKNNMNDSKIYKYGVQWRCWTSRPTDEQREREPWNG